MDIAIEEKMVGVHTGEREGTPRVLNVFTTPAGRLDKLYWGRYWNTEEKKKPDVRAEIAAGKNANACIETVRGGGAWLVCPKCCFGTRYGNNSKGVVTWRYDRGLYFHEDAKQRANEHVQTCNGNPVVEKMIEASIS